MPVFAACFECNEKINLGSYGSGEIKDGKEYQFVCNTCNKKESVPEFNLYIVTDPSYINGQKWKVKDKGMEELEQYKSLQEELHEKKSQGKEVPELAKTFEFGERFEIYIHEDYVKEELDNARQEVRKRMNNPEYNNMQLLSHSI